MKLLNRVFCIAIALLVVSCTSNKENSVIAPSPKDNAINLSDLQVGQQNRYIRFTVTQDSIKTYLADTIVVEVFSETDTGFIFHEYYTEGSASKYEDTIPAGQTRTTYNIIKYGVTVIADTMSVFSIDSQRLSPSDFYSRLLEGYVGGITIRVITPSLSTISLRPTDRTQHPISGMVGSIVIRGHEYSNSTIFVSNIGMATDGSGYTFIIDQHKGLVFSMSYSDWVPGGGHGWELL